MEPMNFEQANKNLLKPVGMTDEECGSLPVFSDGTQCISLWKMTWRERLSALLFGKVWLWVISGQTQPPVALLAANGIFEQPKSARLLRREEQERVSQRHEEKSYD
jgi:hypothetical protein